MQDRPGKTGGDLLKETFVSETTSLEIAAIDLIGIFSDLAKDGQIVGVAQLCEDLDVDVKVWDAMEILNVFQGEQLLALDDYRKKVLSELVSDATSSVLEEFASLILLQCGILFGSLINGGSKESSHDVCLNSRVE